MRDSFRKSLMTSNNQTDCSSPLVVMSNDVNKNKNKRDIQEVISILDDDCEESSDKRQKNIYTNIQTTMSTLQCPLIGPITREIISRKSSIDLLDEVNATTSKMLLLITASSPPPIDMSFVTFPLAETENIAHEIVNDRNKYVQNRLDLVVNEMKDNFDSLEVEKSRERILAQEKEVKHKEESIDKVERERRDRLLERDDFWKSEIDKILKANEREICELRKTFQDTLSQMREEMKDLKEKHERALESYRIASHEALKVIKRRVLGEE